MTQELSGLLYEKDASGVAVLTLNRPERLNAVNDTMGQAMLAVCEEVQKDRGVRVLIVTGAGNAFCSGADVRRMAAAGTGEEPRPPRDPMSPAGEWAAAIWKLEKPTIAAVNGVAAGAGFSVALACDVRIASESARFSAIWIKRGMVPDAGASYMLTRLVGLSDTYQLFFTGKIIDAREAERLGLVSKIVSPDQLMPQAWELARLLAKQAPIALSWAKRLVRQALVNNFDSQIFHETHAQNVCTGTKDHQEGVRAFLEKREPVFRGE